jgi:hypothetical protein
LEIILSTKLKNISMMTDIPKMQAEAKQRHQKILAMIDGFSDSTSSTGASMVW